MRAGRLRMATLVSILHSIQEDAEYQALKDKDKVIDPYPLRSQKQFFPGTFDSPLFRLITILQSVESNENTSSVARQESDAVENITASQSLNDMAGNQVFQPTFLSSSNLLPTYGSSLPNLQPNESTASSSETLAASHARQQVFAVSDMVSNAHRIEHASLPVQQLQSLSELGLGSLTGTDPPSQPLCETYKTEPNLHEAQDIQNTIETTHLVECESHGCQTSRRNSTSQQPLVRGITNLCQPSLASADMRLPDCTSTPIPIPNLVLPASMSRMPSLASSSASSTLDLVGSSPSLPSSPNPSMSQRWTDEYAHIDIDWSMQAMDTLYSASFYDFIRSESNIEISGQKLARLVKEYQPKQVAKALNWIIQGWSVHNTARLLVMIFSDWLPDLAGCVFAILCREWPLNPQTAMCTAYLIHAEPPSAAALFIRSLSNGWKQDVSVELISYVDEVLEWDSSYFKAFIAAYSKLIYAAPVQSKSTVSVDALGWSSVHQKTNSCKTCDCENSKSSKTRSHMHASDSPTSSTESLHSNMTTAGTISTQRESNFPGSSTSTPSCYSNYGSSTQSKCTFDEHLESKDFENSDDSNSGLFDGHQTLLNQLKTKSKELEVQQKALEEMQEAIDEYEHDAQIHSMECKQCELKISCIYMSAIQANLSAALDRMCDME
ncbi:hypothetical protein BATDEDRAFT_26149 [Batrachochytrium dendrobatidis JAM81]|uniref:Uncharacterized protein n=1 Tax=Batrachochytrium dendrobatidis (strain JAM81 / FGSC 10211) TaxID=684364 RepID=F4P6L7_BATDJ|nr:uncharacterized protein BATDEDRAFT_26149 [Batrachochytrium dendrobatidis JAM81]EGF79000.1 hypothetical protein BATDEDRAFT_26149 [Batrachochytrium dendrobatidis JAM81]KAJ8325397.1 hypothetical protein O5D80_006333 [Batrachochytrium dendrobatidis]|eukprot:XP_006680323.1 hypothetical protein BATDEDRAFT_26149 [Batrachochytrium dendrobatidis JAM81]